MEQCERRAAPAASEQLRLERDRHVAFAFAAADLLIEVQVDGRITAASGAARAILGLDPRQLVDRPVETLVAAADQAVARRLLRHIQQVGRIDPTALRLARVDGSLSQVLFGGCRLPNLAGSVFLSVTLLTSVLASMQQERDDATGLLTREALEQMAQQAAGDAGGLPRHLKLVKLDGLSGAVRELAPDRSALLLGEIGAALRAASLGGDTAGRLGDDAFGIVTNFGDDPRRDAALAADLEAVLRGAGVARGRVASRVARIDLALGGLSEGDAGRALNYAINKFVSRIGAEFRIASLQEGLDAVLGETVARYTETQRMIAAREFTLVFQPVVELASRAVHHYEVLSRFPGKSSTSETISFTENVGLAAELDLAVCRRAIEALDRNPTARLAVNLSGRSIQTEAFRTALGELVRPLSKLRHRLLFELTETAAVEDNLEEASNFLRWLRKVEHPICLDDFGAGAVAYSYLRRFDVDYVKIDGPFLKAAADQPRERALIHSICVLCGEIGCKIIGEMIENDRIAALAASLSIDLGQGWLFGKPVDELPDPQAGERRKGYVVRWE